VRLNVPGEDLVHRLEHGRVRIVPGARDQHEAFRRRGDPVEVALRYGRHGHQVLGALHDEHRNLELIAQGRKVDPRKHPVPPESDELQIREVFAFDVAVPHLRRVVCRGSHPPRGRRGVGGPCLVSPRQAAERAVVPGVRPRRSAGALERRERILIAGRPRRGEYLRVARGLILPVADDLRETDVRGKEIGLRLDHVDPEDGAPLSRRPG